MPTVETLEIEVKKSASDASSGIEGLISTLTKLKSVVSGGVGLSSAVNQIKKLNSSLTSIGDAATGIDGTLKKLESIASIDFSNLKGAARDIANIGNTGTAPRTGGQAPAVSDIPTGNFDDADVQQTSEATKESGKSAGEAAKKFSLLSKTIHALWTTAKVSLKGVFVATKAVGTAVKSIGAGVGRLMQSATKSLFRSFTGFGEKASSFIKSISRIALYRLVRSAIKGISTAAKEGVNNLTRYSAALNSMDAAQANRTMSEYASTLQQVKNSIGAAVMPALTALLPIVNSIANAFITAANAVNQFLQALSGKGTFTRAKKNAKDYAESLGGASGAAKDLQKTLLGFDEINRLNDNSSSVGGSGGVDYSDMFEEATVDSQVKSLAERVKEAFSSGEWSELASELAAKINEFSAKLLSLFETPGLKEKIAFMGASLAEGLNTLVRDINWLQLGQAIGAGLNLAITFAVSFLYTFDWKQLGQKLADFVNGLMEKIEWENVGKLLWSKFKIAIETLAGFLENIDAGLFAKSASQVVTGFINSITETLSKVNWEKIGKQIATFIQKIDYKGIAKSLGRLFSKSVESAIDLLIGFVENFDFEEFITTCTDTVWEILSNIDWETILKKLALLVAELLVKLPGMAVAAAEGLSELLANIFKGLGLDGIAGFFEGITDKCKKIREWLKENLVDPVVNAVKDLLGIHSPSTVFADIGKNVIEGFLGGLKDKWTAVKEWWTNTVGGWVENAKNTISRLESKLSGKTSTSQIGGGGSGRSGSFGKVSLKANGGFVSSGELFIARESGPEMVGTIGGRTAVANNDQIVESFSAGVARVLSSAMGSMTDRPIKIYLDGKEITSSQNRRNRMYGIATANV